MERRRTDWVRVLLIVSAVAIVAVPLVRNVFAQSQEYINGSTAMQLAAQGVRLDKIENMINGVLLAMVVNFVAQLVQIKRSGGRA